MAAVLLTDNERTATKARIRRASRQARRELGVLDRETSQRLRPIYERARADLEDIIRSRADAGGEVRIDTLRALLAQVEERLRVLGSDRDALLGEGLNAAAGIGVTPWSGEAVVSGSLQRLAAEAVEFVQRFTANDGLQLSDRLWRIDRGAREAVTRVIEQAVVRGHSASQAVAELYGQGEPPPRDLLQAAVLNRAETIASSTGRVIFARGGPWSAARTVMRTEINRAHGEAYRAAADEHPDVVGMRFLLSPRHPERDICDMHASVNRYGLGAGVYPVDRSPWPAHPNTLSFEEPVFGDEVTKADREGKEDRIAWIKRQPPAMQTAVLGSNQKRAALNQGLLREGHIATPWKVLKKRFEAEGVTPAVLEAITKTPAQAANLPRAPSGPAVSAAFSSVADKTRLAPVVDAIDELHGDGNLPPIPIKRSQARSFYGVYRTRGDRPVDIRVSVYGDHRELTLAHEIGHFLDNAGVDARDYFASTADPRFEAWRRAVTDSSAIRELQALADGPRERGALAVSKKYVNYLLSTHEMWARSYSQWVAVRSGNEALRRQVSDLAARDGARLNYPTQWQDDDFEPIARAIDDLFSELGWTTNAPDT